MDRSLYERLGGIDAITAVVRAFEDRAAKGDRSALNMAAGRYCHISLKEGS